MADAGRSGAGCSCTGVDVRVDGQGNTSLEMAASRSRDVHRFCSFAETRSAQSFRTLAQWLCLYRRGPAGPALHAHSFDDALALPWFLPALLAAGGADDRLRRGRDQRSAETPADSRARGTNRAHRRVSASAAGDWFLDRSVAGRIFNVAVCRRRTVRLAFDPAKFFLVWAGGRPCRKRRTLVPAACNV